MENINIISTVRSISNCCFICGEEPKNHHDHVENRSNSLLNRIINRKSNSNVKQSELNTVQKNDKEQSVIKENLASCLICYDDISDEEMQFACLQCRHTFCHSCWFEYLNEKIGNAKVSTLTCMQHGCKERLTDDFILHHIKDYSLLINKFTRLKKTRSPR